MKEVWVLSVRTSLPKVCYSFRDMNLDVRCFDSFPKARGAFRDVVKGFAFTKNAMFCGDGRITYLAKYPGFDDCEDDEGVLTTERINKIQNALMCAFSGQDIALDIEPGFYTDWMIAATVEENFVSFTGDDDGPCNGYDPVLQTNIFSMEKEQDYYLYINDRFGQEDATSELYIDLKKTFVQ